MVLIVNKGHIGHSTTDLSILRGLDYGKPRHSPLFILVHWLLPQVGWVKLNSDGMARVPRVELRLRVFSEIMEGWLLMLIVLMLGVV